MTWKNFIYFCEQLYLELQIWCGDNKGLTTIISLIGIISIIGIILAILKVYAIV